MRRELLAAVALVAGAGTTLAFAGNLVDEVSTRGKVETFATLPEGIQQPEGITANPANGDVFVATFDFVNANKLLRYDRHGHLLAVRDFGATPLLGLEFGPQDHKVYITNFGASKIQRIAANFNAGTAIEDVSDVPSGTSGIGAPADRVETNNPDGSVDVIHFGSNNFPAPNAMVFDRSGNLYVSDSFQGAIFRIDNAQGCHTPCGVTTVAHDPLLATSGFPPFGANGLALSRDGAWLFVANTGDDRVLKVNLATSEVSVMTESINGADGVAFDAHGRLWVAANQADEVVALNNKGRVIARVGGFKGIDETGAPVGLLFPASLVFVGRDMLVTNLAIALTPMTGDEPEEDVKRWTVSRIRFGRH